MDKAAGMEKDGKAMEALVRFAGAQWLQLDEAGAAGAGLLPLRRGDGAVRAFAAPLLRRALADGLLRRDGERLVASEAARLFLRRRLCGAAEDSFAAQHRDEERTERVVDGERQRVRLNHAESPLAALARMKGKGGGIFLPEEAVAAGERLHADFTRGQLQPRITASWEPRLSSRGDGARGAADLTDSALAARGRVARAVEAMGPELSGVALDVCCFMKGLETVERERQWPARSAKLMLRAALLALSRHYRPPPRPGRNPILHWGAEDFRPDL